VREFAAGWTEQPGFPVVKISALGKKLIAFGPAKDVSAGPFVLDSVNASEAINPVPTPINASVIPCLITSETT